MLGVHHAGRLQVLATILKLLPVLVIGVGGWFYCHPEYYTQSFNVSGQSDFSAFAAACTLTLWAFLGLETGTIPAEATENPKRNIPLATLLGTGIAVVVYIASSAALMGMIPTQVLSQSTFPFAEAARLIFGNWGGALIAAGAFISALGTANGWILIQGQVAHSAAANGYFPSFFNHQSKKFQTPTRALLISSSLMTILLLMSASPSLVTQFNTVILMATLASLFPYFYTSMAYIVLLKRQGKKVGVRHALITTLLGCYTLWMIYGAGESVVFYGCILVLTGVPLYTICLFQRTVKDRA
jgi:APA family basic amino acid/polyamine antiporter